MSEIRGAVHPELKEKEETVQVPAETVRTVAEVLLKKYNESFLHTNGAMTVLKDANDKKTLRDIESVNDQTKDELLGSISGSLQGIESLLKNLRDANTVTLVHKPEGWQFQITKDDDQQLDSPPLQSGKVTLDTKTTRALYGGLRHNISTPIQALSSAYFLGRNQEPHIKSATSIILHEQQVMSQTLKELLPHDTGKLVVDVDDSQNISVKSIPVIDLEPVTPSHT